MNISGKETLNMKLGIIRCTQTEDYCPGSDVNAFVPGAIATALGLALMGVFYYLRERQR